MVATFPKRLESIQALRGIAAISIWRPLTLLGDWSYSLYLCHYIVIVVTYRILEMGLPFIPAGVRSVLMIGSDGIMDKYSQCSVCDCSKRTYGVTVLLLS